MTAPSTDLNSIAFALDSAREDGKAQKERDALIRQAAEFIGELVQHAGAYGEELPRGYRRRQRINSPQRKAKPAFAG